MLIRIITRGMALARVVARDPKMVSDEARAPGNARLRMGERAHVLAWDQLVGRAFAERVRRLWVHDEPVTAGERVQVPLSFGLTREQPGSSRPRVAVRIVRPERRGSAVDLVDGVLRPIHHHVEPKAEPVLMVRR